MDRSLNDGPQRPISRSNVNGGHSPQGSIIHSNISQESESTSSVSSSEIDSGPLDHTNSRSSIRSFSKQTSGESSVQRPINGSRIRDPKYATFSSFPADMVNLPVFTTSLTPDSPMGMAVNEEISQPYVAPSMENPYPESSVYDESDTSVDNFSPAYQSTPNFSDYGSHSTPSSFLVEKDPVVDPSINERPKATSRIASEKPKSVWMRPRAISERERGNQSPRTQSLRGRTKNENETEIVEERKHEAVISLSRINPQGGRRRTLTDPTLNQHFQSNNVDISSSPAPAPVPTPASSATTSISPPLPTPSSKTEPILPPPTTNQDILSSPRQIATQDVPSSPRRVAPQDAISNPRDSASPPRAMSQSALNQGDGLYFIDALNQIESEMRTKSISSFSEFVKEENKLNNSKQTTDTVINPNAAKGANLSKKEKEVLTKNEKKKKKDEEKILKRRRQMSIRTTKRNIGYNGARAKVLFDHTDEGIAITEILELKKGEIVHITDNELIDLSCTNNDSLLYVMVYYKGVQGYVLSHSVQYYETSLLWRS